LQLTITLQQYFGSLEHSDSDKANAEIVLNRVNVLINEAVKYGVIIKENPKTQSFISGELWVGFRTQDCPIGAPHSSHKLAMAVDVYDPENALDGWLDDIKLLKYDLYREHPGSTKGWCHLSSKSPASGKRTFYP
jgi:hypothetical protein